VILIALGPALLVARRLVGRAEREVYADGAGRLLRVSVPLRILLQDVPVVQSLLVLHQAADTRGHMPDAPRSA